MSPVPPFTPDPAPTFTPAQSQVLALIAAGFSATAAAAHARVHRNTVAYWMRSPAFRSALAGSRAVKGLLYWDEAETLAAETVASMRNLMNDPEVPAAVRLKATIAMLEHAMHFLPVPGSIVPAPADPIDDPEKRKTAHKVAQKETGAAAPEPECAPDLPGAPNPMEQLFKHKSVATNHIPAGVVSDFKHCCLAKQFLSAENIRAA